jgi:hypothetical protein
MNSSSMECSIGDGESEWYRASIALVSGLRREFFVHVIASLREAISLLIGRLLRSWSLPELAEGVARIDGVIMEVECSNQFHPGST